MQKQKDMDFKECIKNGQHLKSCDDDGFCNNCGHQEAGLPYAISTSDGHDEEWEYCLTESEAQKRFEALKHNETDIHLFELNDDNEYEVIDSFWIGDYKCPECDSEEIQYFGETMMCEDCQHKDSTSEFKV